ncbi:FUSC family protein [Pseudomonas citronellolis]|uniref:FUSC family protein n=1 Tax=Pseudomonas citronellolis TaxID=53408 RepID=UPI0022BA5E15|nr:FUSC family protein [Pseudomonas citronellolis]WBG63148.1 FUSC family protein [Pseudomonas citronellolis]
MNSLTRISARLPGADALRQAASAWAHSDGVTWVFIGKTLLTAFLALWLAYRLELPQPNTVLVSAFIVLQPQSGQVLAKSFYRILGTLAGLTVMVTFIALFAQERVLFLLCVSLWVGLCTAGAARYRDFRAYACLLAGYTAVMIGIPATLHPEGAFMAALWRVLEITLGIFCTGLVSALVLPQTSSAVLRNALDTRFGDFAGLAAAGLEGTLDHARFEQAAARIAAEAVGLENLRNVTAFEDPHMRLRSGRLARLNSEFMQLTTRFHALQRLLDRLRERQAGAVLEVLMPCLVEVGGLLAGWHGRPLRDADAAFLAAQLEHCRQQLMPQIREARARLAHACPREADQLDFETAAELLFRFAGDLHDYAQTHASLAAHKHIREQWKERFTPKANAVAAAVAGLRCALLVLVGGVFWIETSWLSGATFTLTSVLIAALSSASPNPKRLSLQLTLGTLLGATLGFILTFRVLPHLDGFPLLCMALAPVFALGAFLITRPQWSGYGVGLLVWFCIASLPANLARYDAYTFINEYLAMLLSMGMAVVAAMVILPPNRPWLWERLEAELRMRVVHTISDPLKGLSAGFESGTRDLLNQAYGLASGRPDVQRRLLRWMFQVQEVGLAIIELRREQAVLPDEPWYAEHMPWRRAIRAMGRALIRLFIQPGEHNRLRALAAVEHAIHSTRSTQEPRPPHFDTSPLRRMCSYLHFIRTSLLDPSSPLRESSRG